MTFGTACEVIGHALGARRAVLDECCDTKLLRSAVERLRQRLRAHAFAPDLDEIVDALDRRTQADGFHVLHDWDGVAGRFNPEMIATDVAGYLIAQCGEDAIDRTSVAILLDYYFFHLLGLLSLQVWDDDNAGPNLRAVGTMLERLQGGEGSGQRFTDHAETLLLMATAHYEPVDAAYDGLLEKVRRLDACQRRQVAIDHGVAMGCHLRFGFEVTYGRDVLNMRNDNAADYPWLCFSVAELLEASPPDDAPALEALTAALGPDAAAFTGRPPTALAGCVGEHERCRTALAADPERWISGIDRFRPTVDRYSPLSFFFNFSHNVLKGTIVDAVMRGAPWRVSFNDLLTSLPGGSPPAERLALATTLMAYARHNPHRINGRLTPVIVYDPAAGRRAFSVAAEKLRAIGSFGVGQLGT